MEKKAEIRFKNKIAPGYEDGNKDEVCLDKGLLYKKIFDFIIWKQILEQGVQSSFSDSALSITAEHLSKRESGVTRVFSNSAIRSVIMSMSILSHTIHRLELGDVTRNRLQDADRQGVGSMFISTSAWIGPPACSLRSAARPSQKLGDRQAGVRPWAS